MFVSLDLAKLPNDPIKLVLAYGMAFFFPFADSDDGAAFGIRKG